MKHVYYSWSSFYPWRNGVFKFHNPILTLLFQGIIPHLLMRVVKKIFKDHNCHMSLNYNWIVIYNFSKPNSRKTKVINVDIVKTVSNLCVYNWESIDGDHCSKCIDISDVFSIMWLKVLLATSFHHYVPRCTLVQYIILKK
jgi:hypothetical protein